MDEELASHIEKATDDFEQQGTPRAEARRIALVRFGGIDTPETALRGLGV